MRPIFDNRLAFIKGRSIGDNILLAYEMIRNFEKKGKDKWCIKEDLRKSYDTVNRDFVCHSLYCMGLNLHWINLIRECITTPTCFIFVGG